MASRYWVRIGHETYGPFGVEDVRKSKAITEDTLVCPDGAKGGNDWKHLREVPELLRAFGPRPSAPPAPPPLPPLHPPPPPVDARSQPAARSVLPKFAVLTVAVVTSAFVIVKVSRDRQLRAQEQAARIAAANEREAKERADKELQDVRDELLARGWRKDQIESLTTKDLEAFANSFREQRRILEAAARAERERNRLKNPEESKREWLEFRNHESQHKGEVTTWKLKTLGKNIVGNYYLYCLLNDDMQMSVDLDPVEFEMWDKVREGDTLVVTGQFDHVANNGTVVINHIITFQNLGVVDLR